jgi:retinol dehydrogenase-13
MAAILGSASSLVYNTTVGIATVCALSGIYLLRRFSVGTPCPSRAIMKGKTVIVTGANTGMGKQTALDLARREARVILACRNQQSGEKARSDISRLTGNDQVVFRHLDLASFSSIRKFAASVLREETHIDVLINNAGVFMMPLRRSQDGVEMHLAVNYLGQFLLTQLLLERLKQGPSARVVNVAADIPSWLANVNFEDINSERGYNRVRAVVQSKTCVLLATRHLSTLLENTNVTVNSVSPGIVRNEFGRYLDYWYGYFQLAFYPFFYLFLRTPNQGAQTTIYCAVSAEVEGVSGRHFRDCRETAITLPRSLDSAAAQRLWDISSNMAGLKDMHD